MKLLQSGPFPELASYLRGKRGLITRRWLRAVRFDPTIELAGKLTTDQLLDHLPLLHEEICAVLCAPPEETTLARLHSDARMHGRDRWLHGYQLDELFRELNLLQRCVQQASREFFTDTPTPRSVQSAAHQLIEALFSVTIHSAIRQLLEDQDRQIAATTGERDKALAAQQKSEERLRMAASAAGSGIFEWDIPTRAGIWENSRMYEITGQPHSDGPLSCSAFVRKLVHPDDAEALITQYMDSMQHGSDFHATFRILRIDNRMPRVVELHGRFRVDREGSMRSFTGTLTDITRRTIAEESLRETDRRKDAFLATLAHELRNPLAPIRNAARIIKQFSAVVPPEVEWARLMVERQCEHLTRLIDDLLDVSRISSGKIRLQCEVFDIREAVRSAVEINAPAAEEHRDHIQVTLPGSAVLVNADRVRLTQVFSNLLDNAIKYSNDSSEIAIEVTALPGTVQVVVRDNGMGIPLSQLARMFEPYVQLAPAEGRGRSGLGIGLSVVENLVKMHGGHVTAASDGVGHGSQFTVSLPAADAPAEVVAAMIELPTAQPVRLRVLIVDDNQDAAQSLAMVLDGHEVRCAFNAQSAQAIAQSFHADAVILDIGLPGMSGYELGRHLRTLPGTAQALFVTLSGFGAPEDILRSREAGFARHFVKPVRPEVLIEFLRDATAR
ncbi:response regulator [Paraburkholderia sp. MMS20-SJTR3]|uniref:histidine kinase n=1 Tax=Paraburkholderia sejongensis TaxID=2886946 RepID=A0ABS8K5B0_9BURK|nr:hybrid sensor histidine kinase/response regulator [Paraburkholderia sp. MMS20-SJTR3]MCC8397354.1 response regulator [Paraburkholderia sp. MMS20-SJTR3]